MKYTAKRTLCALLALVLACGLAACGGAKTVDPETCTYDEMVEYLTAKGYISKDAAPVDMLTAEGYLTDNTGGELPFAPFADKAQDYDGLWLMWWEALPSWKPLPITAASPLPLGMGTPRRMPLWLISRDFPGSKDIWTPLPCPLWDGAGAFL